MRDVSERKRTGPRAVMSKARTMTVPLPSREDIVAMSLPARRDLFIRLALALQAIAAEQTLLADHLAPHSDEPLWKTKETAAFLNMSEETVRDRGATWGIQATGLGE